MDTSYVDHVEACQCIIVTYQHTVTVNSIRKVMCIYKSIPKQLSTFTLKGFIGPFTQLYKATQGPLQGYTTLYRALQSAMQSYVRPSKGVRSKYDAR